MEKQIIPQTMHYSCLIRKSYQCVIFVDTQLIQRVTNELCRSEEQMLLTSHMARVVAGHPSSPASRGGALPTPTRHSGVLPAHSSLHSSPSFFLFLFFPLRRRHPPPPPGNDWWSTPHLREHASHTKHSNDAFVSLAASQGKGLAPSHSPWETLHVQPTQPLPFSVHMLTAKA